MVVIIGFEGSANKIGIGIIDDGKVNWIFLWLVKKIIIKLLYAFDSKIPFSFSFNIWRCEAEDNNGKPPMILKSWIKKVTNVHKKKNTFVDPEPHSFWSAVSGSGSREVKMTLKSEKISSLKCWMFPVSGSASGSASNKSSGSGFALKQMRVHIYDRIMTNYKAELGPIILETVLKIHLILFY